MIIAEVGLNHMGKISYSFKYLERLAISDVDAVTYQVREKDFYLQDEYSELKLPLDHYKLIKKNLNHSSIKFGVALADHTLVDKFEEMDVDFYKTLSWDINSFDFIDELVDTGKPIFISTGTSSIEGIDKVFDRYSDSNITFIHTQLNHEIQNVNLLAINFLKNRYNFPIAFGNHCENINVLYTAVGFEPSDIFMYLKTDKIIEHIDEKHSIRLSELDNMVYNLKELSNSLGVANKFDVKIQDKYLILNTKDKK